MEDSVKNLLISMITSDFSLTTQKARKRKIIFWYDKEKVYEESIDDLEIENTEIIKYDNNSIWIRYHIEEEEKEKNIVIYLPIEHSKGANNELLDLETANKDFIFTPDKTTMKLKDLRLDDECKSIIKKYMRFFNGKALDKRENKFKEFDIEKNSNNIEYIITAVLLGIKTINIDDILKNLIKVYYDEKRYEELFKYGNEEFILSIVNNYFGCDIKSKDSLEEIFKSLIFTYFAGTVKNPKKLDRYGKYILKNKITNSQVFANSLMRDKSTKQYFENISDTIADEFGIVDLINSLELDEYVNSDAFSFIDEKVLNYITEQLYNGINNFDYYSELIMQRESKFWYDKFRNEYNFLKVVNGYFKNIEKLQNSVKTLDIEDFVKLYSQDLYVIDMLYRKMYFYFDRINDKDTYIELKNKVENNYINTYMMELSLKWSDSVENLNRYDCNSLVMQNKFYDKFIKPNMQNSRNGRTIVIISDAFRYECAKELNEKLRIFGSKSEVKYMLGLVPSYTQLGMASLLPNKELRRDPKYSENGSDAIFVDGISSVGTENRGKILSKAVPDSLTIQYDKLYEMKKTDWKKEFTGKKVIYIYHDTIDNAGEHDENNVFEACEKAITQIANLVKDLHTTFSGVNCYITADHGFFYKRSKVETYQKTNKDANAIKQKTRYSYADTPSKEEGIISISLDYIFGRDSGYVNIPKGHNVFSKQGGGVNYIHGGILPQEIIIPVIDFKSTRTSEETKKVKIAYSGLSTRITNAITYLEFLQDSNVDENNLPCRYLLHFEDENGNKVSDECTIVANYSNTELKNRFFKEKFVFKNITYDKGKDYYLVITDEETGIETQRIRFIIDITIINNFDF